jgi:CheY-like chemotaxis protein
MTRRAAPGPAAPRVLCVDDEPLMLRLASRLLARMGLVATTASDPSLP